MLVKIANREDIHVICVSAGCLATSEFIFFNIYHHLQMWNVRIFNLSQDNILFPVSEH